MCMYGLYDTGRIYPYHMICISYMGGSHREKPYRRKSTFPVLKVKTPMCDTKIFVFNNIKYDTGVNGWWQTETQHTTYYRDKHEHQQHMWILAVLSLLVASFDQASKEKHNETLRLDGLCFLTEIRVVFPALGNIHVSGKRIVTP